jgi:integrase
MKTLTAAGIEKLKPPARGQRDHFDKGFPGLGLRCSYAGSKSFIHMYRVNGVQRRRTLGRAGAMTLAEAREAWRRDREALARGEDPARVREKAPDTFATIAREWLRRDQASNRTIGEVTRYIEHEAVPAWGDRLISTITRRDALELIDTIVDRGHIPAARRLHAHLHRLFRWSVGRGVIEANPMAALERPGAEVRRERVLSDAELALIWKACGVVGWPHGPLVQLLILTGARRREIGALRWNEIAGSEIKLGGERTKNAVPRTIPLSTAATDIIRGLPHVGDSGHVFTVTGTAPVRAFSYFKTQLDLAASEINGAPLAPWRVHDLRRTVATGLQRLGVRLEAIETVLGHVAGSRAGIVGTYQRYQFETETRAALEKWATEVGRLVGAADEVPRIVPLPKRARHG